MPNWIEEYMAYQGYTLADRLARAVYPTSAWQGDMAEPRTARIWANWMIAALHLDRA